MRRDGARPLDDRIRMMHMLEAAQQAIGFSTGRQRDELEADHMLRRALRDCVQEIGEAASHVSEDGRARAPELPWTQIVGMRHRMVHVYYDLDCNALWEVVVRDLSPLIEALGKALTDWPEE